MPEPEGPWGPLAPLIFGRSVNPISTGEGKLSPSITIGPPKVFHLQASLLRVCYDTRVSMQTNGTYYSLKYDIYRFSMASDYDPINSRCENLEIYNSFV